MNTPNTQTNTLTLTIRGRTGLGKNAAYKTRAQTLVPGVVYGPKVAKPFTISVVPNELRALWKQAGHTGLVTLTATEGAPSELNGQKVLIKDIQTHPFKNLITHVDLHQIDLTKMIRVTVPLNFIGKAKGLAEGGIFSVNKRDVEIKCLPTDIPNHIDVDVSELGINDSIHVAEFSEKSTDKKIEFIFESDYSLCAVVPPEAEETKAAAPEAAAGAPAAGAAAAAGAKAPAAGAKAAPAAAKAPAKK